MDIYLQGAAQEYYRFLKGEKCIVADQEMILRAHAKARAELIDLTYLYRERRIWSAPKLTPTEKRLHKSFTTWQEAYDTLTMALEKRLDKSLDDAILSTLFISIIIFEVAGAIFLPIYTWHNVNQHVLFTILMVIAGLVGGAIIPIAIILPFWVFYDRSVYAKIAWIISRIVVIEQFCKIDTTRMAKLIDYNGPYDST